LLPGCWDREEIEDLAIVRALAVDYLGGGRLAPFLVTLSVIRPQDIASGGSDGGGGGGGGSAVRLYLGTGATIDLAIQQASFGLARRIFLSHNELVLVGEEAARQGIFNITDFIMRNQEMRLTNQILIVPGLAHDVLEVQERLESSVADEILGLIKQAQETSEADPQQTFVLMRRLSSPGIEAYAPLLKVSPSMVETIPELLDPQKQQGGGGDSGQGGGGGPPEERIPEEVLHLTGTAVFRGDTLAGYLNHIETRGFLWLTGGTTRGVITLHDPLDPDRHVNTSIIRSFVTITPQVRDGRISFRVEIEEEGDIISQTGLTDLATPEMIRLLNSAKAAAIKVEIEKALARLQEMGTDIVGFGAALRRKDYKTWQKVGEQWPEIFRDLEIEVHVNAHIRRTGLLSRPVRPTR
jgi:spore germination protein KC